MALYVGTIESSIINSFYNFQAIIIKTNCLIRFIKLYILRAVNLKISGFRKTGEVHKGKRILKVW